MNEQNGTEVHVVSSVAWEGNHVGSGGFWFFWDKEKADSYFDQERLVWGEGPTYVRQLRMKVPFPHAPGDPEVTERIVGWIDSHLELVEFTPGTSLPAERVALCTPW